jgi:hypothetical protein
MLRQAAWAYLHGHNVRKFCFYMSMAGQMFMACQQDKVGTLLRPQPS